MTLKRFAPVEHFVEGEGTLTAARADGTGGGSLTLTFFPAPGSGRVFHLEQTLPTSTEPNEDDDRPGPGGGIIDDDDLVIVDDDDDVVGAERTIVNPGDDVSVADDGAGLVGATAGLDPVFLKRLPFPRPNIGLGRGDLVLDDDPGSDLPPPPPLPARIRIEVGTTISRTNIEAPPRLDSPDARRLRMDRFIPGLDLSSRERDPEDFREIMARFGSPRFE